MKSDVILKVIEIINNAKYICSSEKIFLVDEIRAELSEKEAGMPEDYKICDYCKFKMIPPDVHPCADCKGNYINMWQPNSDNPKEPLKPNKQKLCDICGAMHDLTQKFPKEKEPKYGDKCKGCVGDMCEICTDADLYYTPLCAICGNHIEDCKCKSTCQTCDGSGVVKKIGNVVEVNGVKVQQYEKCDCQKSKSYCRNGDDCGWNKGEGCNRECENHKPCHIGDVNEMIADNTVKPAYTKCNPCIPECQHNSPDCPYKPEPQKDDYEKDCDGWL